MYGYANINISFDGNNVLHRFIVCDITPEGILGQDFLLKHFKMWDLDVPCLRTRQNTVIPLATGGETQTVCSVLIRDKTQLPPRSVCFVPVDIVNGQNLAANGDVEGICSETSPDQMTVVPGIVNPHQEKTDIAIMNKSDDSITLNPGAAVATCSSSYKATEEHHDIEILECDTAAEEHIVSATTRNQTHQTEKQTLTNNQCLLEGWNAIDVAQEQLDDPKIQTLYVAKRDDKPRPEWNQVSSGSSALKTLWRQWNRLEMHAGMLFRKWTDGDQLDSTFQLIVPDSKKLQVLALSHDVPSAGHLGVDKTLDKVRQSFYWPAMSDDVRRYIKSCDSCTARKLSRNKNRAPLGQYRVGEPMERVSIDILGPLPLSKAGNRYILVICDCFTKWTEGVAIPNQEARTVAEAFVNNFVCRFEVPLQLHSDQGKCFESKLFQVMCSLLGIDKTRTTNKPMEPWNDSIEHWLQCLQCTAVTSRMTGMFTCLKL